VNVFQQILGLCDHDTACMRVFLLFQFLIQWANFHKILWILWHRRVSQFHNF